MHKIVHTEFNTKNPKQLAAFVTKLFGWETKDMSSDSEGGMEYITWKSGEDEGGGICTYPEESKGISTLAYVSVENISETLSKAKTLGATVIQDEMAIGPHGFIAIFTEPGGCAMALHSMKASK